MNHSTWPFCLLVDKFLYVQEKSGNPELQDRLNTEIYQQVDRKSVHDCWYPANSDKSVLPSNCIQSENTLLGQSYMKKFCPCVSYIFFVI